MSDPHLNKVRALPQQYRYSYRMYVHAGHLKHRYLLIGRHGALEFHVVDLGEPENPTRPRYSAGLEIHWRTPPDHMDDQPPSHDHCWAINAPCWHDGTSLYADETILPLWQQFDTLTMFRWLAGEADYRFNAEPEE